MLNYAYAVRESQVRIAAVSQGLDPTIGYLHTRRHVRAALVYDLMEPMRPQVDRLVLSFVLRTPSLQATSPWGLIGSGGCIRS
jgi:CRISP-associated protein Cas1